MEITLNEKNKNGEASLVLDIKKEDYFPQFQKKLKEYSKQMRMPGFRPGKVPTQVVRKMHGSSILAEEINQIIGKEIDDYVKKEEINLLGQPIPEGQLDIDSLNKGEQENVSLEFTIGMVKEFDYEKPEKIKLKKYILEVKEEDIDKSVMALRERFGEVINPDKSEEGDVIGGKLHLEGQEDLPFYLPFDKVKKAKQKKFIGLAVGNTIKFMFTDHFEKDDISLLTGAKDEILEYLEKNEVEYEVDKITRKVPAELGQTLFDQAFGEGKITSEEQLREEMVQRHEAEHENYTKSILFRDLRNTIVEKTKITLPDDFLKRYVKLNQEEGKELSEEELEKEFPTYVKDLKWSLIADKAAKDLDVKVEVEDVIEFAKGRIKEQFSQMGMGDPDEAVVEQVAQNVMQNRERVQEYYQELYYTKVFEGLLEKANIKDKKVKSVDDIPKE